MTQEEALELFGNHIRLLQDITRNKYQEVDVSSICSELYNHKADKLNELDNDRNDLEKSVKKLEKEQAECEEQLRKESILIFQQQKLANERAEENQMRNEFKKQYALRLAKAMAHLSNKDIQTLDSMKTRVKAYKVLTGVIWDPSCTATNLHGFIRCHGNKNLKTFNLNIDDMPRDAIVMNMWGLITKFNNPDEL